MHVAFVMIRRSLAKYVNVQLWQWPFKIQFTVNQAFSELIILGRVFNEKFYFTTYCIDVTVRILVIYWTFMFYFKVYRLWYYIHMYTCLVSIFQEYFPPILSVKELSLGANHNIIDVDRLQWTMLNGVQTPSEIGTGVGTRTHTCACIRLAWPCQCIHRGLYSQ